MYLTGVSVWWLTQLAYEGHVASPSAALLLYSASSADIQWKFAEGLISESPLRVTVCISPYCGELRAGLATFRLYLKQSCNHTMGREAINLAYPLYPARHQGVTR